MSTIKIIASINWVLISIYGAVVLWALLQKANPNNDAGGGQMEVALKILSVFLLLVLVGLNLLSYQWVKVVALLLVLFLLFVVHYISTN